MEDLNRMAVFATVVEHGSMSAAARQLGMTPSAISQHIRQLEAQSGVPLMHRTTRKLTLSEAGQRFYTQCAAMVQAARQARAELDAERDEPVGELRIAAVLGLAAPLGQALAPLLHAYPQLRLQLLLDDAHTDLVAERIDLAIRLGTLPDSTWVARPLAELPWYVCAAPALLQGQPPIQHPQQLQTLPWITRHTSKSPTAELALQHRTTGESTTLHTTPRIICNQQQAVQQLCAEGLGIAKLFSLDVAEPIAQGQLQRLLPDWNCGSLTIWALTPQRNALPARVRMALLALQGHFSSSASMPSA